MICRKETAATTALGVPDDETHTRRLATQARTFSGEGSAVGPSRPSTLDSTAYARASSLRLDVWRHPKDRRHPDWNRTMNDGPFYVFMTLGILVIIGWCGVIGYCIYDHATHCTCEEAP